MLEKEDNRFIIPLVVNTLHRDFICGQIIGIKNLGLDRYFFPDMAAEAQRFGSFVMAQLQARIQLGVDPNQKDFFYHLQNGKDLETGGGLSMLQTCEEFASLLFAGTDTTAISLATIFFYLIHNPLTLRALTTEIRSKFAPVDQIRTVPS